MITLVVFDDGDCRCICGEHHNSTKVHGPVHLYGRLPWPRACGGCGKPFSPDAVRAIRT